MLNNVETYGKSHGYNSMVVVLGRICVLDYHRFDKVVYSRDLS